MQIQNSKRTDIISTVLLYAAPIASVGVFCLIQKGDVVSVLSNFVITLILAGIYYTFLHVNQRYFYRKITNPLLYFGSLFLSFIMLGCKAGVPIGAFWMLAVVVAAMTSGMEVAAATHVVLMVQYALLLLPEDKGFYAFLAYVLLGLVLSLLFSLLNEKKAVLYLTLILVACDGVMQCVVYQFNLAKLEKNLVEVIVELVSMLVFGGLGFLYLQKQKTVQEEAGNSAAEEAAVNKEAINEEAVNEEAVNEEAVNEEAVYQETVYDAANETPVTMNTVTDLLEKLAEPEFELLKRLQTHSELLYQHSKRIGELSEKAAAAVQGNTKLAKAGGLYHEIGRVEDENDYIEAGTKLGQAYGFPEELLAVMRQHSTGFELPKSIEAAVVMLSDCIISTSDYLSKNGKREKISDEKLVMSIFQNRLDKGNLEEAGMTEEQIEILRKFYIENTFQTLENAQE